MRNHATLALLAVCSPLVHQASAGELFVDPAGLGDAPTIQGALALAQDGDVLIVRPGHYVEDVVLDDLAVWIVAQQSGGTVVVEGMFQVRNLPRFDHVVLRDLELVPPSSDRIALTIEDCAGHVQVVGCSATGVVESGSAFGVSEAVHVSRAARVTAVDCSFTGSELSGLNFIPRSAPGLVAVDSRVALWGGEVVGADGSGGVFTGPFIPRDGGTGLVLMESKCYASGVTIRGGDGGWDGDFLGLGGADGGDAVETQLGSSLYLVESTLTAGSGGASTVGSPGQAGAQLAGSGFVRVLRLPSQSNDVPAFVPGSSFVPATFRGARGSVVELYITLSPPPHVFDLDDVVSTSSPFVVSPPIKSTAGVSIDVPIPAVPPSPAAITATFVPVLRDENGVAHIGPPTPVVGINCDALLPDCDGSGRSDLCELLDGTAADADLNGRIDACDEDCNGNGIADAADLSSGTSLDVNGNGTPDECEPVVATWFVLPTAAVGGDGSPSSPFRTIEDALLASLDGHTVVLLDGVYAGSGNKSLDVGARALTIRSQNGPASCTVDLEGVGNAISADGLGTGPIRIEGITFENGGSGALDLATRVVEIEDCVFRGSSVDRGGSAISMRMSGGLIRDCRFEDNSVLDTADFRTSGALYVTNSNSAPITVVDGCVFSGNHSGARGGALGTESANVRVTRCRFLENTSDAAGGGASVQGTRVYFDQCLFAGNQAVLGGGAIAARSLTCNVTSSTFVNNVSLVGASILVDAFSTAVVHNSIVRDGGSASIEVVGTSANTTVDLQRISIEGGTGAIASAAPSAIVATVAVADAEPLFVSPAGPDGVLTTFADNDYRLRVGSACVEVGDSALLAPDYADLDGDGNRTESVPLDADLGPRLVDDPVRENIGAGPSPFLDLGCFERQP
ncbi:MAG: right-handed parallel beta-helix repeat-containing protein [Planctomycetota bacterium]